MPRVFSDKVNYVRNNGPELIEAANLVFHIRQDSPTDGRAVMLDWLHAQL